MNAPLRIAELADMLHGRRSNPWKAMALLHAYFDESGMHGRARVTGVAGFVGCAEEWIALEAEWESELRRFADDSGFNIRDFHAYDCENGKSFWFGMDRSIREAYYQRLANILVKYKSIKGISIAIETRGWKNIASDSFKARYRTPYQLCAEHCFQQLASYSKSRSGGSPVAIAFAEHPEYSNHIRDVFSHYMSNKHWANIKSLSFASPKDCTPLQCADMISYEAYRYWNEIESGKFSTMRDRPAWLVLANSGHFEYSACYGGLGLRNAVIRYHSTERLPDPYSGSWV